MNRRSAMVAGVGSVLSAALACAAGNNSLIATYKGNRLVEVSGDKAALMRFYHAYMAVTWPATLGDWQRDMHIRGEIPVIEKRAESGSLLFCTSIKVERKAIESAIAATGAIVTGRISDGDK